MKYTVQLQGSYTGTLIVDIPQHNPDGENEIKRTRQGEVETVCEKCDFIESVMIMDYDKFFKHHDDYTAESTIPAKLSEQYDGKDVLALARTRHPLMDFLKEATNDQWPDYIKSVTQRTDVNKYENRDLLEREKLVFVEYLSLRLDRWLQYLYELKGTLKPIEVEYENNVFSEEVGSGGVENKMKEVWINLENDMKKNTQNS